MNFRTFSEGFTNQGQFSLNFTTNTDKVVSYNNCSDGGLVSIPTIQLYVPSTYTTTLYLILAYYWSTSKYNQKGVALVILILIIESLFWGSLIIILCQYYYSILQYLKPKGCGIIIIIIRDLEFGNSPLWPRCHVMIRADLDQTVNNFPALTNSARSYRR